jgi:putative ABC transport system permease protein
VRLAWRLALRDLRGATSGLLIVLLCLGVGVASVAGIGSLRAAIDQGILQSGRGILGGDIELSTGLGPVPAAVGDWFRARGGQISETVETRSILIAPSGKRLLAAVRTVGPGWPMIGAVTTAPAGAFAALAHGEHGVPGLLLAPADAKSLGLRPGDRVTLGGVSLVFLGAILASPDSLSDSRLFGAKTFVAESALAGTPLIAPGALVNFDMQVLLPPGVPAGRMMTSFDQAFPGNPYRIRSSRNASPDLQRFVDQTGLFMSLLGLAALLVGGIGVANGVATWLAGRARTIATLRCLGASAKMVAAINGLQLALLGVPGIMAGIAVGAAAPWAAAPLLRGKLPLPAHVGLYPRPLLLAGAFGLLVAFVFAFPPLRRAAGISGGALFRLAGLPARAPFSWRAGLVQSAAILGLVALAARSVPDRNLALGFCVATACTLLLLRAIAAGLMQTLKRLPSPRDAALALGLRRLHGPASSLPLMLLSAGAGLTVLVGVAEIRGNLVGEVSAALPADAPSFYFIDIQPDDLPAFQTALRATGAAAGMKVMPSLRARILAVNGVPVEQFHPAPDAAWPLRTDIGFTYAATAPAGDKLAHGAWWPPDYLGPPLVSLDSGIAKGWRVGIGDSVTVDVLGRDFDLKIANLRAVDWQTLQLNFLMVGTPDPFAGAPHTLIATVKSPPGREGDVLAAVTDALPGVTGIDVGQVLHALAGLLGEIGNAVSLVGLAALLAGGLVLISAIAAEREARIAEAVILKTLGASRAQIRRAWLTEFAVAGGIAGLAAAILGTLAADITIRNVFHSAWHFEFGVMAITLIASTALMLALGYVTTARALAQPAAARLRMESGG